MWWRDLDGFFTARKEALIVRIEAAIGKPVLRDEREEIVSVPSESEDDGDVQPDMNDLNNPVA